MRFTHFIISRRADEWIVLYEASFTGLLNWRSKAFERVLFFFCLQLIYFGRRFAAEPNVGTSPTYIFVLWMWNTKKAGNNAGFHHPISQWSQALSAATAYSWARNPAWTHTPQGRHSRLWSQSPHPHQKVAFSSHHSPLQAQPKAGQLINDLI